jgi:hypothetical protein
MHMSTDPAEAQYEKQISDDKNLVRPKRLGGFLSAD